MRASEFWKLRAEAGWRQQETADKLGSISERSGAGNLTPTRRRPSDCRAPVQSAHRPAPDGRRVRRSRPHPLAENPGLGPPKPAYPRAPERPLRTAAELNDPCDPASYDARVRAVRRRGSPQPKVAARREVDPLDPIDPDSYGARVKALRACREGDE